MFGQVSARRESARARRSSLVGVSVAVHIGLVALLLLLSFAAPIPLPSPPSLMAYHEPPRLVHLADIPLPPAPSTASAVAAPVSPATSAAAMPTEAAPVSAPIGIAPESGREGGLSSPGVAAVVGLDASAPAFGTPGAVAPLPQPPPPVRLHSGMQAPVRTTYVAPDYPALARIARAEGTVILEAVIDADGRVTSVRGLREMPLLTEAAIAAVSRWTFTPARLNGVPTPVVMTVTVVFTLN
jgi:protein TonB